MASSTITGALQVAGGVGIGGNIAIGGALYAGGTTGTNGQVLISTGNGISWTTLSSSFNGGTIINPLIVNNSTSATSTVTGALQVVNGGAGIGGNLYVGGNIFVRGFAVSTGTSSGGSAFTMQEFTATAGQTTFTVSSGYVVGSVQVFANGISLAFTDFTATDGSTVVLNVGRNSGDIIRIVSYISSTPIGYTGSASTASGFTGSIGYTGSTGTQGIIGYTGSASTVVGFTGSTGTQGVIGFTGSTGTQGVIGFTGSTGTQGVIGFTGSTGLIANPFSGILTITNVTAASSTITGALQVAGGAGIGGSLFVGGTIASGGSTLKTGAFQAITVGTTAPASPSIGDLWVDTN